MPTWYHFLYHSTWSWHILSWIQNLERCLLQHSISHLLSVHQPSSPLTHAPLVSAKGQFCKQSFLKIVVSSLLCGHKRWESINKTIIELFNYKRYTEHMSKSRCLQLLPLDCMMSTFLAGFLPPVLQSISQEFSISHSLVLLVTGHIKQMLHCAWRFCYMQRSLLPPLLVTCCYRKANSLNLLFLSPAENGDKVVTCDQKEPEYRKRYWVQINHNSFWM